jgi:F-type H+-transporting ATPase subunit b
MSEIFTSLGIDWNSVLLYLVNFGILLLVVMYFATDPILKMLDKRKKFISSTIYESEKLKKEMNSLRNKAKAEKEKLQAELADELAAMKKGMEEKRQEMMKKIEERKQQMLEQAKAVVEEEKQQLLANVEEDILELIQKVVMHVTVGKIPEDVLKQSIAESWKKLQKES